MSDGIWLAHTRATPLVMSSTGVFHIEVNTYHVLEGKGRTGVQNDKADSQAIGVGLS
jgi:hypothetical protein